jgi:hypothetical protein
MMQVEELDSGPERRIIIALITQPNYLARVAPAWEKDCLRSRSGNIVAGWCLNHFRKYNDAPRKRIVAYWEEFTRKTQDPELGKLIEKFLQQLSDQSDRADEPPIDQLLDETEAYLTEVRLEKANENERQLLRIGDIKSALEERQAFKPVRLRVDPRIDVLRDKEAQREALEQKRKTLIRYKGPVGEFFGDEFTEDSFVAYAAVAKGAKSYMLLDNAWMAMLQRMPTVYYQIGDMSQDQIMLRFQERAAGRPAEAKMMRKPIKLVAGGEPLKASVEFDTMQYSKTLSVEEGQRAYEKYVKDTQRKYLELRCYRTGQVSIADIHAEIANWYREGNFRPRVIVLDYLENLAPLDRRAPRDLQVADTWARARQISEEFKCCVITAHQANSEAYKGNPKFLSRRHFRGSLMVLAHVTAFFGILQDDEEKDQQVFRLNCMLRRKGLFRESRCCVVAHCLDAARPITLSWW